MLVPGSDLGPIYDHHAPDGRFCGAFDPRGYDLDVSGAVPCLGKAGIGKFGELLRVGAPTLEAALSRCRFAYRCRPPNIRARSMRTSAPPTAVFGDSFPGPRWRRNTSLVRQQQHRLYCSA
jgi:hypothetical protein